MKKKSFLSGVSAKLALAAVALTSVMFTSCEKEEFNVAPVEQADASAKISITVYDLSDGSIITDATVTNQEGTPVQGFVEVAAGADGKLLTIQKYLQQLNLDICQVLDKRLSQL